MKKMITTLLVSLCAVAVYAESMQGLGALGEDDLPGNAALAGRGYAGAADVNEGLSIVNPARIAFDNRTRFSVALDYAGAYASEGGASLGRDRFDITSVDLSIPIGWLGAIGVGMWQHYGESFNATTIHGVDTAGIQYSNAVREIVPEWAIRLPASLRHVSVGLAWHMPLGNGTYITKENLDTTSLDATGLPLLRHVLVEDRLNTNWSCNNSGYAAIAAQVHEHKWDYFVSVSMPYTLQRTLKHEMLLSDYDTTASSTSRQSIRMPWQYATGITLEPWTRQSISFEFQTTSSADSIGPGLDWAGVPSVFSRTANERMFAIGWQKDGSGIFFDPFIKRNTFRAGVWVRNWYLEGMKEYAGALGYGMPLGKRGAKLDFALYTGVRQYDEPISGNETFWGLKIGFTGIGDWGESSRHRN